MKSIYHGIDIIEISKFIRLIQDEKSDFIKRCFTKKERLALKGKQKNAAGWFSAKEAVLKALGTGWSHNISWTDIEILHAKTGQPLVLLHSRAAKVSKKLKIKQWNISISHCDTHAVASAIAFS